MKSNKSVVESAREAVRSARNVIIFPGGRDRRNREELAFLPAALEIVETPPSPIGRMLALSIAAFFCIAVGWASFGTVDIIASAKGKIIPSGRTKVVQPFETGVVRAIHVHDGQAVKAGDLLIELDPTINKADQGHLQADLMAAELDIARLRALTSDASDVLSTFNPPAGAPQNLVATQRQLLTSQASEQRAKMAALDQQKAQREADHATILATINKLNATIPILQQRVEIRKILYDHETGSKANYLELEQALVEMQQDLPVEQSKLKQSEAALSAIVETRAQSASEFQRTMLAQLSDVETKASGLRHDLDKVNEKAKLQLLRAPAEGTVQQLSVHTIGGVVTPAQQLLVVVPSDSQIEVEAMVSNRDIGFIHAGQAAEIKVDTFSFTRYGLLHGKVISVSRDAIIKDRPQDRSKDIGIGSESTSSEPSGQELDYAARIALDHTQMRVDDRMVALEPGMAVTVEIKTGSRSVMSYLLSPIMRYSHDSLHER